MKLKRTRRGFALQTKICAIGKNFLYEKYFISFTFPFVDFGKTVWSGKLKPRFKNIYLLSALMSPAWACMWLVGLVWMVLYSLFVLLGGANVVDAVRENKHEGGLTNIAAAFCLSFFYIVGIIAVIKFLVW